MSLEEISSRIAEAIRNRKTSLPEVNAYIDKLSKIKNAMEGVDAALQAFRQENTIPQSVREQLRDFDFRAYRDSLADLLQRAHRFRARVGRDTINICVSGQARVGKSTFLQSITGLSDNEIPTGSGLPVTAVRSRIFHSPGASTAEVDFHTFETFRDQVLRPYHTALNLPAIPATLHDFRTFRYPTELESGDHSLVTMLARLRDMQNKLHCYESLFSSPTRTIPIQELRPYIAYPSAKDDDTPHYYLAVRDVRIYCPFPLAQVNGLGLIDLPGLGELVPDAEERHLHGLQNDVDFVIVIKRPVEGLGYWSRQDGNLTNLLDRARGSIARRSDFACILINTGGVTHGQITALEKDILTKANEGVDGKHFRVFKANAKNPEELFAGALMPVLQHLATTLTRMDQDLWTPIRTHFERVLADAKQRLTTMRRALTRLYSHSPAGELELLQQKAEQLRQQLASDLQELVDNLSSLDELGDQNALRNNYIATVEEIEQRLTEWTERGLGLGNRQAWEQAAIARWTVDVFPENLVNDEIHRLRTHLTRELFCIDESFRQQLCNLWECVYQVFQNNLGALLPGDCDGEAGLNQLKRLFDDSPEPCPTFAYAVEHLLNVRLEFRVLVYPSLWRTIENHFYDFQRDAQKVCTAPDSNSHEKLAQELYDHFKSAMTHAIYLAKKRLLRKANISWRTLVTVLKVFEDQFIRSEGSAREFSRFVRCYRDAIFPDSFSGLNPEGRAYQNLTQAVTNTLNLLDNEYGV